MPHIKTQETSRRRHPSTKSRYSHLSNNRDPRALKKATTAFRANAKYATAVWGELTNVTMRGLRELTYRHALSVAAGDLQLLNGRWYVTHGGLLGMATRARCSAITTTIDRIASDISNGRWIFKATVYKASNCRGFVGYGDADPSNVSPFVHGAEMRIAETRAVNRALRKAYGIGLCSVEELGCLPRPSGANQSSQNQPSPNGNSGRQNDQPRLRDRLCLLIRQYRLDAGMVKAYAADYCGTPTLRDASREQVEAFINHLTERASNDREALLCHLNSYPKPEEAKQ